MGDSEHEKKLREGQEPWNEWRRQNPALTPNLSDSRLNDVGNLRGYDFAKANLARAVLVEVHLDNAILRDADLRSANLAGTKMPGADLAGAGLNSANLERADLSCAKLNGARLTNALLKNTTLCSATLEQADLTDAIVDKHTNFDNANVLGCRIQRYTLECLGREYGQLTPGQRMDMQIVDDVATLRASYSGFFQWIHLIALAVFIFPYTYFVLQLWMKAQFVLRDEGTIPLWEAILRFIVSGGVDWESPWHLNLLPLLAFCVALVYNVLRAILLLKTKQLELQENASNLPVKFSLTGRWGFWYKASRLGFWAYLLFVVVNTCHFLGQRVPL